MHLIFAVALTFVSLLYGVSGNVANMTVIPDVPLKGSSVKIIWDIPDFNTITYVKIHKTNSDQVSVTDSGISVCTPTSGCSFSGSSRYSIASNSSFVSIDISSLNRSDDMKWWTCRYQEPDKQQKYLTVYTIPTLLNVTLTPTDTINLNNQNATLTCSTDCAYTSDNVNITWFYIEVYSGQVNVSPFQGTTTSSNGSCTDSEQIYTSVIHLSKDNSIENVKAVKFICKISGFPGLTLNATTTGNVTFAESSSSSVIISTTTLVISSNGTSAPKIYSWSQQAAWRYPINPKIGIRDENNVLYTVYVEYNLDQCPTKVESFNSTGSSMTHTLTDLKMVRKYYLVIYAVNKDGTTSDRQYYEAYAGGWLVVLIILIILLLWILMNIILNLTGRESVCMKCVCGSFHGQPVYKTISLIIACILVIGWIYRIIVACIGKISNKDDASCFEINKIFPKCKDQTSTDTISNDGAGRSTPVSKTDIRLKETTTVSPRRLPSKQPASDSFDRQPLDQIPKTPRAQPSLPNDEHAKTVDSLIPKVEGKTLPPLSVQKPSVNESGELKKPKKKKKKNKENNDQSFPSQEDDEQ